MITAVPFALSFGGRKTVSVGMDTLNVSESTSSFAFLFSSFGAPVELGIFPAYKGISCCAKQQFPVSIKSKARRYIILALNKFYLRITFLYQSATSQCPRFAGPTRVSFLDWTNFFIFSATFVGAMPTSFDS